MPVSFQEDFTRTELILAQITERLNDVCAPDDAPTLDTLQLLLVVFDLYKQLLIDDPQAANTALYGGTPPATAGFEAVLTVTAAVQDHARQYAVAAPDLDALLNTFIRDFTEDFGMNRKDRKHHE